MRPLLLIVNDDGVGSPFLPDFADAFSSFADVLVVVPATEQSWIGRAYNRHGKIEIGVAKDIEGFERNTVTGTPSDCVNIALSHILERTPDAVVSGLNIGQNVGIPLLWSSGTFSAAAEGAAWGIPSFAFSKRLAHKFYNACRLEHRKVEGELKEEVLKASKHAADFVKNYLSNKKFNEGDVVNVNYPEFFDTQNDFKFCVPAKVGLTRLYNKNGDGLLEFKYAIGKVKNSEETTDLECLDKSLACYSVLNVYKSL